MSLIFIYLSRYSYRLGMRNTQTSNVLTGLIYENISGAKLVLGFGDPQRMIDKINVTYDTYLRYEIFSQLLVYTMTMAYRPIGVVIVLVALLTSRAFGVPASELAILLLSLLQIANAFSTLLANKTAISKIIPGYEQIQGLRAFAREMKQGSGQLPFKGLMSQLQLEQISFYG